MALKHWLLATRIKTLPAGMSPVLVGLAGAQAVGFYDSFLAAITLACSLLIQIGTNFANDYYDFKKGADTEKRIGPTRMLQAGHIKPKHMKIATALTFTLAFFLGLILVAKAGVVILIIGIVSILCGYLYTAGPYALAYIGLGDLFVLIFFGPVAVMGTYYVQTGTISLESFISGLGVGLLSTAILVVNNVRDYKEDKSNNKKTLVVRFGINFGKAQYCLCMIGAISSLLYLTWISIPSFIMVIIFIALCSNQVQTLLFKTGPILNNCLARTGGLVTYFTLIYCIEKFMNQTI